MFSGIIGEQGEIVSLRSSGGGLELGVRCTAFRPSDVQAKDSIAIDGVCLTVTRLENDCAWFDVVPETLSRTTLHERAAGDCVNVELALRTGDRIGGHFVYGHVDATAPVLAKTPEGQGCRMRIALPASLRPLVCEKAFVAVDGVSVTAAAAGGDWFEIALIPETLSRTSLGRREPGSRVNLEADPLARYAARALECAAR